MRRNVPLPWISESYSDETRPWTTQDVCNWLPTPAEREGTLTPVIARTPPGLSPFVEVLGPGGAAIGPVRGTHNAEGKLFAVMDRTLYRISNAGSAVSLGTVPGFGRVRFAHNQITNGNEVVVVNGSAGYTYNTVTTAFSRITDQGYPGAITTDFIDGYVVGIEPGRRFAFNSDLANARKYNTLDRFTSEYKPDLLVTQAVSNNELVLFSETSAEFFVNTGAPQQPFRTKRVYFDKGCSGVNNAVTLDNTAYWHGNDGIFYILDGTAPKRISTRPIEQAVAGLNWAQAFGFTWEDEGYSVAYWTFPDGQTWGRDASSGRWHRRDSLGINRWRVNSMTRWRRDGRNVWIAGDFRSGRLWQLDWDYFLEGSDAFVSEVTGAVIHNSQNPLKMPHLELMMGVGQQLTPGAATDQAVRLSYSDDGGHNPTEWREEPIGQVGQYQTRITFDRLGQFRQRTMTIQCSSPCRRDFLGAVAVIK